MNQKYRKLMLNAFAKLGAENQGILIGYYDALAPELGEEATIDLMHRAFLELDTANASAGFKNLLSETAQKVWDAIDGKTIKITSKSAIDRCLESLRRMRNKEGKELEVEIGGKVPLGVFQTKEVLRDNGVLERHRIYKAVASEVDSGFEIEVRL